MTYDERVEFYVTVCDMPREEAEAQALLDVPVPDLKPDEPVRFMTPADKTQLSA